MSQTKFIRMILAVTLLVTLWIPVSGAAALPSSGPQAQDSGVTAYDLIIAMNTLRASYGLPALIEDPIVNAVAQSTAEIMAANQMSWHIGDVSGRLAAAGYGGGAKVWATENFAAGANHTIDEIMVVWSDESHMLPAVKASYCNVGAGVAKSSNGLTYYVLQAAYTSGKSCGSYTSTGGSNTHPGGTTTGAGAGGVSQLIVPVKIATPDAQGRVIHKVQAGQSFWAIAVAYKITIKDIETWNNISKDSKLQVGQELFIPGENTAGFATPTPPGMILVSTPDADGKVIHTVQSYQTLSTIATAYKTDVDTILALNGWQIDWPLQIGQKLLVHPGNVTPSPTPRPLTPIEKLTPASDGKYYHVVRSGESLSWIADLYDVPVNELMAWNALGEASILQPDQKLLLQVTPPATETPTPAPATATGTPAPTFTTAPTQTPTPGSTGATAEVTATVMASSARASSDVIWSILGGLGALGILMIVIFSRKR